MPKNLSPVYVLSSDEPLLKNERSAQITKAAQASLNSAELLLFTSSDFQSPGGAKLASLENELMDPGLFGGDRIIKIYLKDLDSTALEVLHLLSKRSRDGVVSIVDLPRIAASYQKVQPKTPSAELKGSLKSKALLVFSFLKSIGSVLEIMYPPTGGSLISWITSRCNRYGLRIDKDGAEFLSSACEGNLILIDQTLTLIRDCREEKNITADLISSCLTQDSRFSGYELGDAILTGDGVRALNILNSLTFAQGNLTEILGTVLNNLDNSLFAASAAKNAGLKASSPYKTNAAFLKEYRILSPDSVKAVALAAENMPRFLLDYLKSELNKASLAYSSFDFHQAYLLLQNLCTAVSDFNVMKLKEL